VKVLVCGSRDWTDLQTISVRMAQLPPGSTVIHGAARGADTIAAESALRLGLHVHAFPAQWTEFGKAAGAIRNSLMLDEKPDLVIAFWDGESRGTKHTIDEAERRGVPVEIVP
jgi:hypothetical protein